MALFYTIKFTATNSYQASANESVWHLVITPGDNASRILKSADFGNPQGEKFGKLINGDRFQLSAAENHIKVAHGKDHLNSPSIRGIVTKFGANKTTCAVQVSSRQQ